MLWNNVELHNVEEVRSIPERDGVRLQRVPEAVRQHLNPLAQEKMLSPAACEIRFVSDEPTVNVTLSSAGKTDVAIFHGGFETEHCTVGRDPETLRIVKPANLLKLDPAALPNTPFSHRVSRMLMGGANRDPVFLHRVEGKNVRPPALNELPRLRYIAYGTSITQGAQATGAHLTYAAQTGRRLGADLINLGVGGSAYCENELADYMAQRDDWHVATLALSVNMIGAGFSLEEFGERVSYMVHTVCGSNPIRPVGCITIFPYFLDLGPDWHGNEKGTAEEFRQKLRDAVASCPHPNAHLIEGPDILTDFTGLKPDLIHPGDIAMIEMGHNLAERLRPLLSD